MLKGSNLFIFENLKRRNNIKKASLLRDFFYLRQMKEEDLPYVLEIENLSFPNPWHEMTFKGEIHNEPISSAFVIFHRLQKKVIGYIIFWHIKEQVQISNIAIHPDFRRMGIAEAVLKQVLSQIQMEGSKFVTLEVRPSNLGARSLYHKLGFEVLGLREDYYHDPSEPALVMCKQLN